VQIQLILVKIEKMKKIVVLIVALTAYSADINAQAYPSTVGLRASVGNFGAGPELSYQHGLGDWNRVELGVGIGVDTDYERFGLSAAYHWVGGVDGGFYWFAGPAAQGWLYTFNGDPSSAGAFGAHFGVEYDFNEELDLPFTASADSRPMFNFVSSYGGFEFALGVSIRYTF
jgi:hypothetical protein